MGHSSHQPVRWRESVPCLPRLGDRSCSRGARRGREPQAAEGGIPPGRRTSRRTQAQPPRADQAARPVAGEAEPGQRDAPRSSVIVPMRAVPGWRRASSRRRPPRASAGTTTTKPQPMLKTLPHLGRRRRRRARRSASNTGGTGSGASISKPTRRGRRSRFEQPAAGDVREPVDGRARSAAGRAPRARRSRSARAARRRPRRRRAPPGASSRPRPASSSSARRASV